MRTTLIARLWVLAIAAAVLAAGLSVFPSIPARADAVDDAVEELKDLAKAKGEEGRCLAKMAELETNRDERVTKAFLELTKSKQDKIAAAAMLQVAKRRDAGFLKKLKSTLDNKKVRKERPEVYIGALQAAEIYADPKLLEVIEEIIKKNISTDPEITAAAVGAYGSVKDKKVVDVLLEYLEMADTGAHGSGGGGGNISQATRDNYSKAKTAIMESLTKLTGLDIGDAKTWKEVWEKRRDSFEFPTGEVQEVDVTTLREWTDPSYGYTVTLPPPPENVPEGKEYMGWSFSKEKSGRLRAMLRGEDGTEIARIDYQIHNTSTAAQKSVDDLLSWFEKEWTALFTDDIKWATPPQHVEIGGRDWGLMAAKGQSGGTAKGWGSVERRMYMAKMDHLILYISAIWRLGAEQVERDQAIAIIEGTTFGE